MPQDILAADIGNCTFLKNLILLTDFLKSIELSQIPIFLTKTLINSLHRDQKSIEKNQEQNFTADCILAQIYNRWE
jgi:hypothetical protein